MLKLLCLCCGSNEAVGSSMFLVLCKVVVATFLCVIQIFNTFAAHFLIDGNKHFVDLYYTVINDYLPSYLNFVFSN